MRNHGTFVFGDAKFVHEEFDTFGDFRTDNAFFKVSDGAIVTTNDFIFGGAANSFVVSDTFTDDINTHVGRRIIDIAAGDAMEDFFEDWEDIKVTIIVDDLFAVMFEMEVVNHVDVAEVSSSGLVGDVDWVL